MYRIVDVSNNNGSVNWVALKRGGVRAAWLKVTEGKSFVDSWYSIHNLNARRAGFRVGGYHFGHPHNDPIVEANHFLDHLRLRPGDLLPVLDIETTDGCSARDVEAWASWFLRQVKIKTGATPVIYTGDHFARTNLRRLVGEYPLWVASYGAKPKSKWHAWQWTDRNKFRLDESVAPNPAALIYKPTVRKKVVKHVKKPVVPLLRWRATHQFTSVL